MSDPSGAQRAITDALLIAVLTAWSYAIGFAYLSGIANYFGFPIQLATPSATQVLQAAAALSAVLLIYFVVADFVWSFAPRSDTALARAIRRFIALSLIFGFMMYPFLKDWRGWISLVSVSAVYGFFEFVFPLITQRAFNTYEAKLEAQQKIESGAQPHSLMSFFHNVVGKGGIILLLLVMLTIMLSYNLGLQNAREQETFFVLEDAPDSAVLHIDGEVLVAGSFDQQTKMLKGSFIVRKLSDGKPWLLRQEKIGPLVSAQKPK